VVAAVPILRELRSVLPDAELILSVITPAGREMAEQQAAKLVDSLFYAPFDLPWVTARVVKTLRPDIYVSLESELWPNLLHHLKKSGAKTVLVNGRISEKNFRRSKTFGLLFQWMLGNMDALLMQSAADAQRIQQLGGIKFQPGRVAVIGNSKFDQEIGRLTTEQVMALRQELHLPANAPVFVAGSTRSPEEEQEIFTAYRELKKRFPTLCLIVAPRQVVRGDEVETAMKAMELEPVRRSKQLSESPMNSILLLDTMGELANVYAIADFAFVGNSFPPVVNGGGQNLLQPLAHGKPVLFGPKYATIRSEVALAMEAGVGFQVENGAELVEKGTQLLESEPLRREIEAHALDLIAANRGVSAKYAQAIVGLLSLKEIEPGVQRAGTVSR
jgi:3-deoxy-D-manno-octulosonic-acid transferase